MRLFSQKTVVSPVVIIALALAGLLIMFYSLDVPRFNESVARHANVIEPSIREHKAEKVMNEPSIRREQIEEPKKAIESVTSTTNKAVIEAVKLPRNEPTTTFQFDEVTKAHDSCARSGAQRAHDFFKKNALSFVGTSESKIWEVWGNAVKRGTLLSPTLVLDIGANVGQSGYRFLDIFPEAIVNSFEPGISSMESLKKLNETLPPSRSSRWKSHPYAMASTPGELSFSSPETGDSQTATLGSSSRIGLKHNFKVKVSTVDSFLSSYTRADGSPQWVDLLKIDVEGWECDVMAGASVSLGAIPPRIGAIYFEYGSTWFDERHGPAVPSTNPLVAITTDLHKKGYECFLSGVSDLIYIGPAISSDLSSILFGDVSGYGPNVFCLHRSVATSKVLFDEHPKSTELNCQWW
jgi:FkbM family methyltransferase